MRNARKMDSRITVGQVPDSSDLEQLSSIGFKTLVDVRDDEEKFGGFIEKKARDLGLRYVSIPVRREEIKLADVTRFYEAIYEKSSAPLYVFSRYGKKPLAFILLLEAVANGDPLGRVFQRASRIGIDLYGDIALQSFLVKFYNAGCMEEVVASIRKLRPDLMKVAAVASRFPVDKAWASEHVQREERQAILGQKGCTIWLTGLPSAGKSTTAFRLEKELVKRGFMAYVLDSDNIRHGLNRDLGFGERDREENIRRVAEVAKLLADSGLIAIASFISPYRKDREQARALLGNAGLGFVEVFVDTPVEVCEERDPRGMYKKAREGDLSGFTGVDAPYEAPRDPEVVVKPASSGPDGVSAQIVAFLESNGLLAPRA